MFHARVVIGWFLLLAVLLTSVAVGDGVTAKDELVSETITTSWEHSVPPIICGISREDIVSLIVSIDFAEKNFLYDISGNTIHAHMWWHATVGLNSSLKIPLEREGLEKKIIELRDERRIVADLASFFELSSISGQRNAEDFFFFVTFLCSTNALQSAIAPVERAIERAHRSLNNEYTHYFLANEVTQTVEHGTGTFDRSGDTRHSLQGIEREFHSVSLRQISQETFLIEIRDFRSALVGQEIEKVLSLVENTDNSPNIILDLRGNPGGLLNVTIDVAQKFIQNGDIVYTQNNAGEIIRYESRRSSEQTKLENITVLVDGNTASAAEILAAALKTHGATLVGNRTFGKGVGQIRRTLPNGGVSSITTFHIFTPEMESFHRAGLRPDILASVIELNQGEGTFRSDNAIWASLYHLGDEEGLRSFLQQQ